MKEKFLKLSRKLSLFQTKIMLALVYFIVLCPIALLWKLFRIDPLNKAWKKSEKSYMMDFDKEALRKNHLEKPY